MNFFNLIKSIYQKSKANVILTGEKLDIFLSSGMRQGSLHSPPLASIVSAQTLQ